MTLTTMCNNQFYVETVTEDLARTIPIVLAPRTRAPLFFFGNPTRACLIPSSDTLTTGRWIQLRDPLTLSFGPDVVQWKADTVRELMRIGVMQSAGFYIVSGGFMLVLSRLSMIFRVKTMLIRSQCSEELEMALMFVRHFIPSLI